MKAEAKIFLVLAIFFLITTPVYWFLSHDPTGTAAMTLTFFLMFMITAYLALVSRKMDPRPEDKNEGEIAEGAGELGFFPPSSIWPLFCALTLSMIFLGAVFGWWLTLLGIGLGIFACSGWIYQYYRNEHAH